MRIAFIQKSFMLLKPYKRKVFYSLMLSLIITFFSICLPIVNEKMINKGIIELNKQKFIFFITLTLLLNILSQVILSFQTLIHINLKNEMNKNLSNKVFSHLLRLKNHYFEDVNFFQVITTVFYDVEQIVEVANQQFLNLIIQFLKVVGSAIGLYFVNKKITLLIILVVILRYFLLSNVSEQKNEIFEESLSQSKYFTKWYSEMINGIKIIKLWNLYSEKTKIFHEHIKKNNIISKKTETIFLIDDQVSELLDHFLTFSIFFLGFHLILNSQLTIGGLFSITIYSQYVMQSVFLLSDLSNRSSQMMPIFTDFDNFFKLEKESSQLLYKPQTQKNQSIISFNKVSLKIDDHQILKNVSFTVTEGEKVAIIGKNGSGKSTIIDLLLRLKDSCSGEIRLDNVNIYSWELDGYREKFSVIEQRGFLFDDSIENNILLKEGDDQKINDLTINEWLSSQKYLFGERYYKNIGQNGAHLSGGERQNVLLMRGLVKQGAEILILDEASSDYDVETEKRFNSLVRQMNSYRTILVITHRPEILKEMDTIFILKNGQILEVGSYEELATNKVLNNFLY